MSKQLATLQYDIETGVDLAAAMASEPDRGALREFMREFELRAVLERLEEALPEGDAVPGRRVETELEVEAEEGKPADLGRRGRWRWRSTATAGPPPKASASSPAPRRLDELAVALGGKPFAAHDAKSLGGGRHGLLAAAAREGVELNLDHDTMVAAYLLEPQRRTYDLVELAADAGIGLAEGAAAEQAEEDDGQLALGEELEAGLDPAEEARLVAALAAVAGGRGSRSSGLEQLLREVELPLVDGAGGDGARGAEARRRAPGRGRRRLRRADRRPWRRRSSSWPRRSSRSARRSRSAASSSRSSA